MTLLSAIVVLYLCDYGGGVGLQLVIGCEEGECHLIDEYYYM